MNDPQYLASWSYADTPKRLASEATQYGIREFIYEPGPLSRGNWHKHLGYVKKKDNEKLYIKSGMCKIKSFKL